MMRAAGMTMVHLRRACGARSGRLHFETAAEVGSAAARGGNGLAELVQRGSLVLQPQLGLGTLLLHSRRRIFYCQAE